MPENNVLRIEKLYNKIHNLYALPNICKVTKSSMHGENKKCMQNCVQNTLKEDT